MTKRTGFAKLVPASRRPAAWLFYALIALLAYIAFARLSFTFQHLLNESPLDLRSRYLAVSQWFTGNGLYATHSSTYPPASYLILWPILGWLPFETARRLWALLVLLALGWLAAWCVRGNSSCSGSRTLPLSQRCFAAMFLLAMTSTSVAVWLGQSIPLLLALLTLAILLLYPARGGAAGGRREAAASLLMLVALVKPSVSAPFLWLLLWSPARPRASVSVVFGYVALTLAALWFQKDGFQEVLGWAEIVNRNGAQLSEGYANLRVWLAAAGLKAWSHPASLLVLLWLGFWTHAYRRTDVWLRLGVVGLIARLWTYHNSYDDMLLILPMLALLRIAACNFPSTTQSDGFWNWGLANLRNQARQAQILFGILASLLLLLPSWLFQKSLLGLTARGLTGFTMVMTLAFLLRFAKKQQTSVAQPG